MISLRDDQLVKVTLDPRDKKGKKASIDTASIKFTSSNEEVFTVEEVAGDPLSRKIVAQGPGVAQLDYSLDANTEVEGLQELKDFTAVEVKGGAAVGLNFTTGPKEEQPEPNASGDHSQPEPPADTPPADTPPASEDTPPADTPPPSEDTPPPVETPVDTPPADVPDAPPPVETPVDQPPAPETDVPQTEKPADVPPPSENGAPLDTPPADNPPV